MNDKYFKLYSFNIPVKGKTVSAIYNLQRGCIYKIPNRYYNFLAEILDNNDALSITASQNPSRNCFRDFLRELHSKEIGFFTDSPNYFPPMDDNFHFNSFIERAILEYSEKFDLVQVFGQLDNLLCKYLEIRFEQRRIDKAEDLSILEVLDGTSLRAVNVVLNYTENLDLSFARECFNRYSKLHNIIVMSSPSPGRVNLNDKGHMVYLTNGFEAISASELLPIQKKTIVNRDYFFRSKQVNPYYFGKICISRKGAIKNNLQHLESFGNINKITIRNSLERTGIKELWNISVDQIESIRDSHLRYANIVSGRLVKKQNGIYRFV